MKNILYSLLLLILALTAIIYFIALPAASKKIKYAFESMGASNVKIQGLGLRPDGLSIKKIILDNEGFSTLEDVKAQLYWPTYLLEGDIDNFHAKKLTLITLTESPQSLFLLQQKISTSKISEIPLNSLKIDELSWDTKTPAGILAFKGNALLKRENDKIVISANINAIQNLLSFESHWSGQLDKEGLLNLEGAIDDFHLHFNMMKINRGTGWVSYSSSLNKLDLAGQIEAGSGEFLNIPINHINFVIGETDDYRPLIFRADASGIENVNIMSDFNWKKDKTGSDFKTILRIKNMNEFLNYLQTQKIIADKSEATFPVEGISEIIMTYLPEKKFADGPMPFDLTVKDEQEQFLNGTFLIYPESLDVRGTLQIKDSLKNLLLNQGIVTEDIVSDGVIRLDENIKPFFSTDDQN